MAKLGFVGLGVMGSRVVKRLLDAGHEVTGYNRTKSKAQWLVDVGMKWADTPREVVEASDVSLSMVTNTNALQSIAEGPDGLLTGLKADKLYIDMSTISPAYSQELAKQIEAQGAAMLDAPVSGSVITLEEGKLSIMVGGDVAVFEKVKQILLDIGPKVTYVGKNGLAVTMKIATNLSLAAQMLAFSEGVLIAEKSGIKRETAVEVLTNSVIASPMVKDRGPFVLQMPGLAHLYSGQEAVAVGVCEALRKDDYVTSTHRGHGHCLAKGASIDLMFAELLGKEAGYCKGKGGSMHIADPDSGNLGANAIVGGSAGIATGAAFSAKMRGSDQVAVCFFGEGALGQGLLYEVMNMASLWKLPVIYVCENNMYNEYTHYSEALAGEVTARAKAFGIYTETVDGQDVQVVNEAMQRLVERARRGEGPAFLECMTYRYYGHHVGVIGRTYYRSKEEEQDGRNVKDPLKILAGKLSAQNPADRKTIR